MKRFLAVIPIVAILTLGFGGATQPAFAITNPGGDGGGSKTQAKNTNGSGSSADGPIVDPAVDANACNQDHCDIIDNYVNPFIKLLTVLVGLAVTIGIIFGAIEVSSSAGDPQRSASGKNHIRNAIIGLVAYVLLFGLLQFIIPGGI